MSEPTEPKRTKFFLDTEFIEAGRYLPVKLISIGIVSEDGREFYAESIEFDPKTLSPWLKANVLPHLGPVANRKSIALIAKEVSEFIGDVRPEFWGYYADYDWVVFCQMFGSMIDLPKGWPMYCRDIKQLCDSLGNPKLPENDGVEHNALTDAKWNKLALQFLLSEKVARSYGASGVSSPDSTASPQNTLAPCPQRSRWIRTADQVPCKADARPYGYLLERWEDGGANYVPWQNVTAPYWMPLPELNEPLAPCPIKDEGEETKRYRLALVRINAEHPLDVDGERCSNPHCWPCKMWQIAHDALGDSGKPEASPATTGKGPMEDCISDVQQFLRERSDEQGGLPVTPNSAPFGHNPAHACGTCQICGEEMVWNVPRLGPGGGYVHKATGHFECVPSPALPLPLSEETKKDL